MSVTDCTLDQKARMDSLPAESKGKDVLKDIHMLIDAYMKGGDYRRDPRADSLTQAFGLPICFSSPPARTASMGNRNVWSSASGRPAVEMVGLRGRFWMAWTIPLAM
ncbi:hypothetical protein V1523DRAFT_422248 [Lipomyces doorenjongii]